MQHSRIFFISCSLKVVQSKQAATRCCRMNIICTAHTSICSDCPSYCLLWKVFLAARDLMMSVQRDNSKPELHQ
jgi:hypothetical protein